MLVEGLISKPNPRAVDVTTNSSGKKLHRERETWLDWKEFSYCRGLARVRPSPAPLLGNNRSALKGKAGPGRRAEVFHFLSTNVGFSSQLSHFPLPSALCLFVTIFLSLRKSAVKQQRIRQVISFTVFSPSDLLMFWYFRARWCRMDVSSSSLTTATADVDLNGDAAPLQVDISDALSEKDKVKFTVHTR